MMYQTLDEIYPRDTFLAPRLAHKNARWAPSDTHSVEFMTANLIACAGNYPMLVHKAAMSPKGLDIMDRCGVDIGSAIEVYETPDGYDAAFKRRHLDGEKAILVFPAVNEPGEGLQVESNCLEFLNNKSNIAQLAGADNVPHQQLIDLVNSADRPSIKTPIVLKIATDEPNAGGLDVAVCRKRRQLTRALKRFAEVETLIAEQFIEATHNWCVQFAVLPDGTSREIGSSQQICMRNGIHSGNLLADERPSSEVMRLARSVAEAGSRLGFRGLCGFDILTDYRGKPYVIDLNFRPVSSAAFVLEMQRRKMRTKSSQFARLAFCKADASLEETIRRCRKGFDEGWLIPLATFDPEYGGLDPGPARLRVVIVGDSRKALHERERSLAACGIEFFRMPTRWDTIRQNILALF
ncbi:MAG: hypothetical protein CL535_23530 [Ahrensia sp.]|mgnify:CR=1 FL=1|nr:hypothetical protein [Ahrensia sp.]